MGAGSSMDALFIHTQVRHGVQSGLIGQIQVYCCKVYLYTGSSITFNVSHRIPDHDSWVSIVFLSVK
jgi:hypothetical protein